MVKRDRGASDRRRSRNERYGRRPVGTRPVLPVIVLVFDDSKTAPAYFNLLKGEIKQYMTLKVISAPPRGWSPDQVVEQAVTERKDLDEERDAVWAVFDMEHIKVARDNAEQAKVKAETKNVNVARSDPCFEVWTLLHLEDTGKHFKDCEQVIDRIKTLWKTEFGEPFEQKAHADYSQIMGRRNEAACRAKQHHQKNPKDPSWTEIYKIIDAIESIIRSDER